MEPHILKNPETSDNNIFRRKSKLFKKNIYLNNELINVLLKE